MAQHNSFIDGIGLTETNSLIHPLNNNDTDDNNEAPILHIMMKMNFRQCWHIRLVYQY